MATSSNRWSTAVIARGLARDASRRPSLVAIGHLESRAAYDRLIERLSGRGIVIPVPAGPVGAAPGPMCVSSIRLRSPRGPVVRAMYMDVFLGMDEEWSPFAAAERIRRACAQADDMGARLGVLGGGCKIVARDGRSNGSETRMPFTTGNALTAAVIAEQVKDVVRSIAARVGDTTVVVVGAGGDVGSGVCRILDSHGFRLVLVGRRLAPLTSLTFECRNSVVRPLNEALPMADIIVLVASVPLHAVCLIGAKSHAIIIDAGHPPNARSPGPGRYALGGRVRHSAPIEADVPEILYSYAPTELHACLAEGEVLAFEGRWEAYSNGRETITPTKCAEILRLACRHGIFPARLHFEELGETDVGFAQRVTGG